jgi:peptidyl-prolyl cis-trans isomerase B (cyclophilin B)
MVTQADDVLKLDIVTAKQKGSVLIQLLPDKAPNHVARIKQLVADGAYNNMVFHRVIPGFMAQTGDVAYGNRDKYNHGSVGTGGSQYKDLYAELSDIAFEPGIVGMARNRYIHSANSQFFIMTASQYGLNSNYTVIGVVIEGLELVRKLKAGTEDQGKVVNPDYIETATIISKP